MATIVTPTINPAAYENLSFIANEIHVNTIDNTISIKSISNNTFIVTSGY